MINPLITVLIVDDEVLARVGLKSLMNWEELGFVIVGEAENGEKALTMIEELNPDLVLTDIKMPLMNGLELMKKTRRRFPAVEFIILSSYDDFKYAREAMLLGAKDYILKLEMDKISLKTILLRIKSDILHKTGKKKKGPLIEREKSAMENQLLKEQILSHSLQDGIELLFPYDKNLYCLYIHVASSKGKLFTADEQSTFQAPIINFMKEILLDHNQGHICSIRPMEFVLIFSAEHINSREERLEVRSLIARIQELLKNYFNLTGIMAVSGPKDSLESLNSLYKEARDLVDKEFVYSCGTILPQGTYGDTQPLISFKQEKYLEHFDHFLRQFKLTDAAEMVGKLEKSLIPGGRVDKGRIIMTCYHIRLALKGLNLEYEEENEISLLKQPEYLFTLEDIKAWLKNAAILLRDCSIETPMVSPLIRKAVTLIEEHFTEELSLTDIAENLDVSSGYLSQQFKKELGKNFSDYIIDKRTGHAAQLLIKTDLPIQKIAIQAGYENIYYFSRVFKQRKGQSPREYRKTQLKQDPLKTKDIKLL